jgi:hypothetical protein
MNHLRAIFCRIPSSGISRPPQCGAVPVPILLLNAGKLAGSSVDRPAITGEVTGRSHHVFACVTPSNCYFV